LLLRFRTSLLFCPFYSLSFLSFSLFVLFSYLSIFVKFIIPLLPLSRPSFFPYSSLFISVFIPPKISYFPLCFSYLVSFPPWYTVTEELQHKINLFSRVLLPFKYCSKKNESIKLFFCNMENIQIYHSHAAEYRHITSLMDYNFLFDVTIRIKVSLNQTHFLNTRCQVLDIRILLKMWRYTFYRHI
jgi:hypothetical protein